MIFKGLFQSTKFYLIGELFTRGLIFFTIPMFTKALSIEEFSRHIYLFSIYIFVSTTIIFFADNTLGRSFVRYGKNVENAVLTLTWVPALPLSIISFIVVDLILGSNLEALLIVVTALLNFRFTLLLKMLQMRGFSSKFAQYQILQAFIALVSAFCSLHIFNISYFSYLFSLSLSMSIIMLWLVFQTDLLPNERCKNFKPRLIKAITPYILTQGFWGLMYQLSLVGRSHFDRIYMYDIFSNEEMAVYSLGAQLGGVITILIMSINRALTPVIWRKIENGTISLAQVQKYGLLSGFLVPIPSLFFLFIPENTILLIIGSQYAGLKYFITIFLFANSMLIPYHYLSLTMFYLGKNHILAYIAMISFLFNTAAIIHFVSYASLDTMPYVLIGTNLIALCLIHVQFNFLVRRA